MRNSPETIGPNVPENTGSISQRNPLASYAPTLFAEYPPESEIGRLLRKGDAKLRLLEMKKAEPEFVQREQQAQQITDRVEKIMALHQTKIDYMLRFGCMFPHRRLFGELLQRTSETGLFSLSELAYITANAKHPIVEENANQSKGVFPGGESGSSESPDKTMGGS